MKLTLLKFKKEMEKLISNKKVKKFEIEGLDYYINGNTGYPYLKIKKFFIEKK